MSKPIPARLTSIFLGMLFSWTSAFAQAPTVQNFSPGRYSLNSSPTEAISVQFDQAMDASTIAAENFRVYGSKTGFHDGTLSYDGGSQTATFEPAAAFEAGEMVTVVLTQGIRSQGGTALASSFLWSFFIQATTGTAEFTLDSAYLVGDGPHFVGIGELDGSAGLDVVIPHSKSHDSHTLLNQGNGQLTQIGAISLGTGARPRAVAFGDFDSDGDVDVAVVREGDNKVSILDNNGSGSLSALPTTLSVGTGPAHISSGDLNGDGFVDLVTVNGDSLANNISVLLNNGDGTFGDASQVAVGKTPQWSFIADFNNDGSLDIVVSNQGDNTVSLLTNDGNGTFSLSQTHAVGTKPRAIDGHDFNGDGLIDIVVTNISDNTASVLLNSGGSFAAPADFPVGQGPFAVTAADFDGDRDADFVVVNRFSNDMYVLLNNGSGFFQIDGVFSVGTEPRGINSGDFDGDGVLDLGVANYGADSLSVFFNEFLFVPNQAPSAPTLASPNDLMFFNPNAGQIVFNWNVPDDPDGDALHFKLEVSQNPDFASPDFTFDSNLDVTGFSPAPPVAEGTSTVSFNFTNTISDGLFWWRVTAFDGQLSSLASAARRFQVDTEAPTVDNIVITPPDFQPNWYNQNTTGSISFGAQYDESHALRADFDLAALGGSQVVGSISSGQDQTVQVPVTLTGASDGTHTLTVTIVDSIGNQASGNSQIALDGTPPSGTTASSPALSATTDFQVSWAGTGSDGSGSGLSGVYDVKVQIDALDWIAWRTNFQGTSDVFQGSHGSTYRFEARAHDNLSNLEPFTEIAETQTVVDTNANDVTAPGAPISLTAAGSNPSPWQATSDFQINWQPPTDPSGIGRALYKLGAAPNANFDTTGSVASGTSLSVRATEEDGQNFHLWFEDQQGNVDFNNHGTVLLRYDATPPDLVEIDIQNQDFSPNWFNPTKTPKAQVEINYDEEHMQRIQLDSDDLGANIQVTQPVSGIDKFHLFELSLQGKADGVYKLAITLSDSAGNMTLDSISIRLDATAPTGTRASSPDTSKNVDFVVSLGSTGSDGSGVGLAGIYDVRYQVDDGAWLDWPNFSGTFATFNGQNGKRYGFEASARDQLGNREAFSGTAETVTVVDTGFTDIAPPTISHSPQLVVDQGDNVSIRAQIDDNVGISNVVLYYRNSGNIDFKSRQMTDSGAGLFEVTFTPEEIPMSGINYYISAFDGSNFSFHPSINWDITPNNLSVRVLGTQNQGLARNEPLPGGDQSFFFRMISVPLNLEDPDPLAVFQDDLGSYDPKKWRLFQYKPGTESYSEYPDIDPITPGKAFWIIVREPNKVVDSGIGSTVASNQPFIITLEKGWNDIAPPFNFPIEWSNVQVIQGNPDDIMGPYTYQEDWLPPNQVSTLFPWEGYAVFSVAAGVQIQIDPVALVQTVSKTAPIPDWEIGIEAVCGEIRDRANFLGVVDGASEAWDSHDYLEPPYIGDFVSVRFPHDDWETFQGAFMTDFRPQFEEGQVWRFEVRTNIPNQPVTLRFRNVASLPEGMQAILLDRETLRQLSIGPDTEYEFIPENANLRRSFDLFIGTEDYIRESEALKELTPESFFLSQNFPNPFNAGTSLTYHLPEPANVQIKVLNILGQEVRELLSERRSAGTFRIHWDGRSQNGKDISSGIYLVTFEAGDFRQIRKITLVR